MVTILKASGKKARFSPGKALRSCLRSGASTRVAEEVVVAVQEKIEEGATTQDVRQLIAEELLARERTAAKRYDLRYALARLRTENHDFEKYVTALFSYHGYRARWSPRPKPLGYCTDHEIDVLLEKDSTLSFVECKHHIHYYRHTGLDVPMRVWARLQDLRDGHRAGKKGSLPFERAMVVTNTKFSRHALEYAACKGLAMMGWRYPREGGIENYIESVGAYPVTLLDLSPEETAGLSAQHIIDIKTLLKGGLRALGKAGVKAARAKRALELAAELAQRKNI